MAADPRHIGLIAGSGMFPLLFAQAARQRGVRISAVALRGESSPALAGWVDSLTWLRVGQLGHMIGCLRRAGVRRACMAGGVRKTRLYQSIRPDWTGLRLLLQCMLRPDDGFLRAVAGCFEAAGIRIVDSTLYMPEALAPAGVMSRRQPTARQWHDLHFGLGIAREIGRLDVGQTVVVREGAVLAMEAMEGTDACLARAGALAMGRRAVAIKVAKPSQDMRFDVPTIGVATLERMAEAGIEVLGVEAGRTLLLEPEGLVAAANRLGLVVVGLGRRPD